MRLFVGTSISESHGTSIGLLGKEHLDAAHWRTAPLEQWHVTSLFIGERDEQLLDPLMNAIAKISNATPPIVLREGRIVSMPKEGPTMLWIRFRPEPELTALHMALAGATGSEPSIYRPYWPHITLARSRGRTAMNVDGPVLIERLVIDRLSLFVSEPTSAGRKHRALGTWELKGIGPTGPAVAD